MIPSRVVINMIQSKLLILLLMPGVKMLYKNALFLFEICGDEIIKKDLRKQKYDNTNVPFFPVSGAVVCSGNWLFLIIWWLLTHWRSMLLLFNFDAGLNVFLTLPFSAPVPFGVGFSSAGGASKLANSL